MAKLYLNGSSHGDVVTSDKQQDFPCMDSNYREMTWTFTVVKAFNSFHAILDFEQDTVRTYFSDREKDVVYDSDSESDCVLQSYKRKAILSPVYPAYAEYEIVLTKEN